MLSELEFFDSKAEREALAPLEIDICLAIKGDLMNLYM